MDVRTIPSTRARVVSDGSAWTSSFMRGPSGGASGVPRVPEASQAKKQPSRKRHRDAAQGASVLLTFTTDGMGLAGGATTA